MAKAEVQEWTDKKNTATPNSSDVKACAIRKKKSIQSRRRAMRGRKEKRTAIRIPREDLAGLWGGEVTSSISTKGEVEKKGPRRPPDVYRSRYLSGERKGQKPDASLMQKEFEGGKKKKSKNDDTR